MGRSEQANTLVVDSERNVRNTVGWVPSVTFFRSVRLPVKLHNGLIIVVLYWKRSCVMLYQYLPAGNHLNSMTLQLANMILLSIVLLSVIQIHNYVLKRKYIFPLPFSSNYTHLCLDQDGSKRVIHRQEHRAGSECPQMWRVIWSGG